VYCQVQVLGHRSTFIFCKAGIPNGNSVISRIAFYSEKLSKVLSYNTIRVLKCVPHPVGSVRLCFKGSGNLDSLGIRLLIRLQVIGSSLSHIYAVGFCAGIESYNNTDFLA